MKDGYIEKDVTYGKPTEEELKLINLHTRREYKADEVYVFTVILCDNEIDREFERFTKNALIKLSELFVGKTGILDHNMKSENQTARIFSCEVEEIKGKLTSTGEQYYRLKARAYMPRISKNNDFISEIDSGIKKEISVGCAVSKIMCSICGENMKSFHCDHIKGKKYNGEVCHYILEDPVDAYEWSFVAVPAQKEAKVIKSLDFNERGGGNNLEDVIKMLSIDETVTMSKKQSKDLLDFINDLKKQAEDGKTYKEDLRKDVMKYCSLADPQFDIKIMDSVTKKMNLEELKSFKTVFQNKVDKTFPVKPQLLSSCEKEKKKSKNTEFKI